jgi:chaperone modulatory protein CbpM
VTFALVRARHLNVETLARATGLHPDLVRRLIALGLLDAVRDYRGELWFDPAAINDVYRLQRLRAGLSLNYASLGVVVDLLDRITELETELRNRSRRTGDPPWT